MRGLLSCVLICLLPRVVRPDSERHGARWFRSAPSNVYEKTERGTLDLAEYAGLLEDMHTNLSLWPNLMRIADDLGAGYRGAQPYPHASIDGMFPDQYLRHVAAEYPELTPAEALSSPLIKGKEHCANRFEVRKCGTTGSGPALMRTPWSRGIYQMMMSPAFTLFLEELTGIHGLVADPSFTGSGFDQTLPGGSLAIHTDYHYNPAIKLTRRVNVFVYLNHDWKEEYGGNLELWSATPASASTPTPFPHRLEKTVSPIWNRMFVFSTGDRTFHGHPMPLNTTTRNRRSIAMYYHANDSPKEEVRGNTVAVASDWVNVACEWQSEQRLFSQVHQGVTYSTELPDPTTLKCSGVPPHHVGTMWPTCEDFERVGGRRKGQNCRTNSAELRAQVRRRTGTMLADQPLAT